MSENQASPSPDASGGGPPETSQGLPDLNGGTLPFDQAQKLLDQVAWINLFVSPGASSESAAVTGPGGTVGVEASEALHRFDIHLQLPSQQGGIRAANIMGQQAGKLDLSWLVIPWDFEAQPGRTPPPTALDPSRSQRFVLQTCNFSFGEGNDGFSSFGTGRTIPSVSGGQSQLDTIAVGNMTDGFGKFSGLEGTFVLSGRLQADRGFTGNILVRVVDPNSVLKAAAPIPPITDPQPPPDPGVTYVMMRSQKIGPQQKTLYSFTPQGEVRGLIVPQDLRCVRVAFEPDGATGFGSEIDMGPYVGHEDGYVTTDPTKPPKPGEGTADQPSIFQGAGEYAFNDPEGQRVGGFNAQFLEGRTFNMTLQDAPGQIAARFGFVGPIISGSGYGSFRGVEGLMTGTTGVTIAPHVFSNLYVLRLNDPDSKYLAALDAPACG